jgi:DNA polymerase-3 subunit gamma/tau
MTDQAARLGTATLSRLADIVHTGLVEMRGTTSPRLLLELVSARMLLPAASTDGAALLQRLERMERRLSVSGGTAEAAPERGAGAASGSSPEPTGAGSAATRGGSAGRGPAGDATSGPRAGAARGATEPGPDRQRRPDATPDLPADERAAAVPEPRPHTPMGELDAAAVRRIWPEVLDAVKRRRRTAHALLMNVSVHSVDNGVLTLTISSVPLSRLLAQDANTDVVRSAVKDVLGVDWRIAVVVDGGGAAGGDPGAAPPPDEDPRDDEPSPPAAAGGATRVDPEEAAISLLQSTLGAKRMDG